MVYIYDRRLGCNIYYYTLTFLEAKFEILCTSYDLILILAPYTVVTLFDTGKVRYTVMKIVNNYF